MPSGREGRPFLASKDQAYLCMAVSLTSLAIAMVLRAGPDTSGCAYAR